MSAIKCGGRLAALALGLAVWSPAAVAQCPATTGEDATLVVPTEAVNADVPLNEGDVLRAYDADSNCVGEAVWKGDAGSALTLWGDDVTTSGRDGLTEGEAFELRAVHDGEEVALVASFSEVLAAPPGTEAEYYADAIYYVAELKALDPTSGEGDLPGGFRLSEVHPNPSAATSALTLELARTQDVTATVYDVLGRAVQRLHAGPLEGGQVHRLTVEADGLPSGAYFVRVEGEDFVEIRRLTLLR